MRIDYKYTCSGESIRLLNHCHVKCKKSCLYKEWLTQTTRCESNVFSSAPYTSWSHTGSKFQTIKCSFEACELVLGGKMFVIAVKQNIWIISFSPQSCLNIFAFKLLVQTEWKCVLHCNNYKHLSSWSEFQTNVALSLKACLKHVCNCYQFYCRQPNIYHFFPNYKCIWFVWIFCSRNMFCILTKTNFLIS